MSYYKFPDITAGEVIESNPDGSPKVVKIVNEEGWIAVVNIRADFFKIKYSFKEGEKPFRTEIVKADGTIFIAINDGFLDDGYSGEY